MAQGSPALEQAAQDHGDPAGAADPLHPAVSPLPLPVAGLVLVPSGFSTDLLGRPGWERDEGGNPGKRPRRVREQREGAADGAVRQGKPWEGKEKQNEE